MLKPREQRFIKIEAPFIDEISGLFIVIMLDRKAHCTLMPKLKFVRNTATLDVTNISFKTVMFNPKVMFGILDLRSISYYKNKQADEFYEQFNEFVKTLKEEKEETNDKYPRPDKDDERRNMSDKEILEKYIDLENHICQNQKGKK